MTNQAMIGLVFGLSLLNMAYANNAQVCSDQAAALNQIAFNQSAEGWVIAEKALVTLGIDANLDEKALDDLEGKVLSMLKTLSENSKWRLTQHDRSQDQSGLERVHIEAEARLPESALIHVQKNVKKISKPGFNVNVLKIEYRPSNTEIEKVTAQLREDIYRQIKAEIERLNQIYPKQPYFVNRLVISEGDQPPFSPDLLLANGVATMAKQVHFANSSHELGISKRIKMNAAVLLGSKRE